MFFNIILLPRLGLPSGPILSDYTNKSDAYMNHIGSLKAAVVIMLNSAFFLQRESHKTCSPTSVT